MKVRIIIFLVSLMLVNSIWGQYKIGDVFYLGNFKYCVSDIKFTKEIKNSVSSLTADGIFLILNLTVTNITREPRLLMDSMFKVTDSENYEFTPSLDAMGLMLFSEGDKIRASSNLSPKIPKEMTIPFEVPTSDETYKLKVSGGFWTGKSAFVTLKNN